jgi:uncharacterized protein YndB with AHSA1/START domain
MNDSTGAGARILGSLRAQDGEGVVRIEDRLENDIDGVWSALTDPARLARWYGEIEGELRLDGEYRARLFASGWEGVGRVEACEPHRRFVIAARDSDEPGEQVTEVTLAAVGDRTVLVVEQRGVPVNLLAAYGAGVQIHVEDLAAHLAGRERCDAGARWGELSPAYDRLAVGLG